jgi:hypothetical protein
MNININMQNAVQGPLASEAAAAHKYAASKDGGAGLNLYIAPNFGFGGSPDMCMVPNMGEGGLNLGAAFHGVCAGQSGGRDNVTVTVVESRDAFDQLCRVDVVTGTPSSSSSRYVCMLYVCMLYVCCMYVCMYVCLWCVCVCMYVYGVCVSAYACMYVSMHVCMCILYVIITII